MSSGSMVIRNWSGSTDNKYSTDTAISYWTMSILRIDNTPFRPHLLLLCGTTHSIFCLTVAPW